MLMPSAADLGQWGDLLTGLATFALFFAAIPAVLGLRRARRAEAATWLDGIFREFYVGERFRRARALIEYDFETISPLFERRITDRRLPVSSERQDDLEQVDTLLKYFEFVLHLREQKLLGKRDPRVVLNYWFDLLRSPERASLRRYVDFFGWHRLADVLNDGQPRVPVSAVTKSAWAQGDHPSEQAQSPHATLEIVALPDELARTADPLLTDPALFTPDATGRLGDKSPLTAGWSLHLVRRMRAFDVLDEALDWTPAAPSQSRHVRRVLQLRDASDRMLDVWVYVRPRASAGHPRAPGA